MVHLLVPMGALAIKEPLLEAAVFVGRQTFDGVLDIFQPAHN